MTATPTNLAYTFLLTLTMGALFAFSEAHHRLTGSSRSARWTLAAGWLLTLRLFSLTAAFIEWSMGGSGAAGVLPALETFIDLASLMLFGWAFLVPEANHRADQLLMIGVVFNVVVIGAALVAPQLGLARIGLDEGTITTWWFAEALFLALGATALLALSQPPQWILALVGFGVLSAGYLSQSPLWTTPSLLSTVVRLMNAFVLPLLSVAAVRSMIQTEVPGQLKKEQQEAIDQLAYTRSAEANIAMALASLASAENPDHLAARAARAVAETMRSEYCLVLTPPDSEGEFSVATGYDLIREQLLPGASLDEERSPALVAAFREIESLRLSDQSSGADVLTMKRFLGLGSTGPILFVPISKDQEVYGGLLLLSPFARRTWTDEQEELVRGLARHLAQRFTQFRTRAPASGEAYDALLEAQDRIHRLEHDNMRLFEALHAEGDLDLEALQSIGRPTDDAQQAQETIAILEAEIERLKTVVPPPAPLPTSEELEQLKDELQSALESRAQAVARIDELEATLSNVEGGTHIRAADVEAIASIASELRQPMSTVLGYTDLLLGESVGLLGAMQRKFLERVRGAIERMSRLLNDLVQVTALETGSLNLQIAQVNLLDCVERAVREIGGALREKDIALQMDFPDEVPGVLGDEEAITQIALHLLKNAVAATPENETILLSAVVERSTEEGFLMLSVRDAGDGIPSEDLGRVFQRLYEADRMMISGLGDTGVGLSLVKALSEALGGRVWVESDVGVGSKFTVLLPLADPAAPFEDQQPGQSAPPA
ncbi:MAG: ATP-binding protein [Anaerolineales bacterium]